ncbi:ATP-binding protein [uncultured Desulfobacter sp.]|uniref:ATP-binding protein n=1 Tax=uncultured Desulfobacter sp. TaxID=240139 RepID=UPI0029F4A024|nr:ATP-binding protein [uncultured Desulfobacter sp.]
MTTQHSEKPVPGVLKHRSRRMFTDLMAGLMSIVVIVAGLSMGVSYFIAYQKAERSLNDAADQYLSYLTQSLELPIWFMDDKTIRQISDVYMASGLFSLLEIVSNEDEQKDVYSRKKADEDEIVLREGPVIHGDEIIGSIRIGLSTAPYKKELDRLLKSSIWIASAIVLAMMTAIFFLARRLAAPIAALTRTAVRISEGQLDLKAEIKGSAEVNRLAAAFNKMTGQLGHLLEKEAERTHALEREIAERKQIEEALREKDDLLHDIGRLAKIGGWKIDIETGKATWTDEVSRIHDLESNQALRIEDALGFFHGEHREKLEHALHQLLDQGLPYDLVVELVSAKKISKWVRACGHPVIKDGLVAQIQGTIQDITERKRMEEMMIQSEKMLSLGGLAAGMAHEINNPLAGIMQTIQVMTQRLKAGANLPANQKAAEAAGITMESIERFMENRGIPRMINAITDSGKRVSGIVTNMLNFARKDDTAVSTQNLNKILDNTIELAATDYNLKKEYDFKQVRITREYDNSLPDIPCQVGKIQQVVLNILANGAQAMQGAETPNAEFFIRTYVDSARDMACVEIEDNGPGMDEKVRKLIFDPFFTTKPAGMGTGLGLSVSYFIITENHKGEMAVESSPGAGAKFIIRLPLFMDRY